MQYDLPFASVSRLRAHRFSGGVQGPERASKASMSVMATYRQLTKQDFEALV